MVDFSNLINLQIEIFILVGIGYLLTKLGMITKESRATLTSLVINVILPANIINSYMIEMNMDILKSCALILIVSIFIQMSYVPLNKILYRFNHDDRQLSVLKYATLCSNAGFLGNPLVEGIYGSMGLLYASIFLIPQRIVMWTAGVSCFTTAKGKDVIKKLITNPCIIATIIGLLIMIFQIPLPDFATKTIKAISSCTTVMSILVIGSILSDFPIKEVFSKLTAYYSFLRLIVLPALCAIICVIVRLPILVTCVASVLVGMPAGTTTAILAEKYGGDSKLGVQLVFLSTLCSLITIPILVMVLEKVL